MIIFLYMVIFTLTSFKGGYKKELDMPIKPSYGGPYLITTEYEDAIIKTKNEEERNYNLQIRSNNEIYNSETKRLVFKLIKF